MVPVDKVRARALERQAIEVDENLRKAIQDIQQGKSIHQVLAEAKVPKAEILKFFAESWRRWQSNVLQNTQAYTLEADVPQVQMADMNSHGSDTNLGNQGEKMLFNGLFKAMGAKAAEGGEEAEPLTAAELEGMAREAMDEWENFMGDMWSQVLDQQMVKEYQQRMSEIQTEVRRIIALAKSGAVGPEYVLIALAKVNVAKNGVLFTWLSKKAFGLNEEMTRASEALSGMDSGDPNYFATLQSVQGKTRDGGFQLTQVTNDMQKVMQNVASTMETVHGIMGEINRTRREIITKVAAR